MEPGPVSDEEAVAEVIREVDQIARRGATPVNVDVQVAAQKVKAALKDLRADAALYARVKGQASVGEFDFAVLDRLQRNGPALWLLGHRAKIEREQSARLLDEATLARAMDVRVELLRVASYHFGRDPKEADTLEAIGNTGDHLLLANDLRYLHGLCVRHKKRLAADANCTPELVAEARQLADRLREAMEGRASSELREVDRVAALWSMVKPDHDALVEVLRYLLRASPDRGKGRFPRLVGGPGRGRRASEADGDDDGDGPAEEPDGGAAPTPVDAKPAETKSPEPKPAEPVTPAAATKPKQATAAVKAKKAKKKRG
jgi:cell division septation protein DedD